MLLTVQKLIYGGDGLARLPAEIAAGDAGVRGKAVFLPFVIAGERVEASLTEQKPGFARARVDSIVEPSSDRVVPACPYFGSCGGCHYQHARYEYQLEVKANILHETLRRTAKMELEQEVQIHPSPPWHYRNRSRLRVRTGAAFAAGYYKAGSHHLLPIQECPISSPLINRGISALWESGRAGKVPSGISEVEFFANADDSKLLIEISCRPEIKRSSVRAWAEDWCAGMADTVGVAAFRGEVGAQEKFFSLGDDHLIYETSRRAYRVSAGSFFQTNRFITDALVEIVSSGEKGDFALDLYAGVGLFSKVLGCDIRHIVSVESSQTSSADLAYNQPSNGEVIQAKTEEYLARAERLGRVAMGKVLPPGFNKPDLAVVDPPRGGLGERVVRQLTALGVPRVTYVSCDPATLARDLVQFVASGYRVKEVHLVDLFPQTYHIESVVKLSK